MSSIDNIDWSDVVKKEKGVWAMMSLVKSRKFMEMT
jgi:hypothetical protein